MYLALSMIVQQRVVKSPGGEPTKNEAGAQVVPNVIISGAEAAKKRTIIPIHVVLRALVRCPMNLSPNESRELNACRNRCTESVLYCLCIQSKQLRGHLHRPRASLVSHNERLATDAALPVQEDLWLPKREISFTQRESIPFGSRIVTLQCAIASGAGGCIARQRLSLQKFERPHVICILAHESING